MSVSREIDCCSFNDMDIRVQFSVGQYVVVEQDTLFAVLRLAQLNKF